VFGLGFEQGRAMRLIPLIALLTLSTATGAVDKVQSLNVKLGLWEVTTTAAANTEMPIPAGLLEKLTPEQRARVEERIKARSSDTVRVIRRKYCLTKEKLNKGPTFLQDRKSCTRTLLTSNKGKVDMRLECFDHGIKSDGSVQIEALSFGNVKGAVRSSATGGENAMNSTTTFTAKWIGPLCSAPEKISH
jgi:hypothetical protein